MIEIEIERQRDIDLFGLSHTILEQFSEEIRGKIQAALYPIHTVFMR